MRLSAGHWVHSFEQESTRWNGEHSAGTIPRWLLGWFTSRH